MPSPSEASFSPTGNDSALQGAMPEASPVREIDVDTFRMLIREPGVLVVYFFGKQCAPCRQFAPILEELSRELGSKLTIVKMDIAGSDMQQLSVDYRVNAIPTLIVFRGGQEELRIRGVTPKRQIEEKLTPLIEMA